MVVIIDKPVPRFEDYVLLPRLSNVNSRADVNLEVTYTTLYSKQVITGIPVFCSNLASVAGKCMSLTLAKEKIFTCLHKFLTYPDIKDIYCINKKYADYIFYTLGLNQEDENRFYSTESELYDDTGAIIKNVCLDVANGYISKFIDFVKKFRQDNPNKIIMAGNVCTPQGCEALIKAGADIIKVNIGTGQQCLTTNKAAVGRSSMQTILECVPVCNYYGALLISDGGYSNPARIVKGLAAGAHGIMVGTMFAGTTECCGEFIYEHKDMTYEEAYNLGIVYSESEYETKKHHGYKFINTINHGMKLYGMASKAANDKFCGGLKSYRAAEGRESIVPYKGPVKNVVQDITGSLRSACTYLNVQNLQDISNNAIFERI